MLLQAAQKAFMAQLFADALNFGGTVMIRRIVGIAHIDDFKDIQDEVVRYAFTTLLPPCYHISAHKTASGRYHSSTISTAHEPCVMRTLHSGEGLLFPCALCKLSTEVLM